ncbi:unnamed protein product [Caenorhabditis sp. 36 PRJEB53466]|nr:unnamed protein product [Caenorhabditis sp. 36 PRJEB53466]
MAFRGYNNGYHNYHRGGGGGGYRFQNQQRINENEVPQSKHTIFIRGLPGDYTTEEIKEYIGERVGQISFDFVKVAQDRSKIFVAVRFEKRDEAKKFMEEYKDREFMGFRCDLSWFRDIRRYCAYKRSKEVHHRREDRRFRLGEDRRREGDLARGVGRVLPTVPVRLFALVLLIAPALLFALVHRSDPGLQSVLAPVLVVLIVPEAEAQTERAEVSPEAREEAVGMSREADTMILPIKVIMTNQEEIVVVKESNARKTKQELPQIPLPPKTQKADAASTPKPKPQVFIPPPSVDMELDSPREKFEPTPPRPMNPYAMSYQKEPSPTNVHNTLYAMPMEEEAAPKVIIRESQAPPPVPTYAPPPAPVAQQVPVQVHQNSYQPAQHVVLPAPAAAASAQTSFVPRQIGKIEILMPASLPAPIAPVPAPPSTEKSLNGSYTLDIDSEALPNTRQMFGHLKAWQSVLAGTINYADVARKVEEEEDLSTVRLSSLANDENSHELKLLEREERIAKLNGEQLMRFHIKRKQFEAAFRNDCETYAVVTRALLSKDETLQFGIKIAFMENIEGLFKTMLKRVDDLLDTLVVLN